MEEDKKATLLKAIGALILVVVVVEQLFLGIPIVLLVGGLVGIVLFLSGWKREKKTRMQ